MNHQKGFNHIRPKGYTLIEVLIAMFIFVVVVTIISVAFIQTLNNIEQIKERKERLSEIQIFLNTIQFDLFQTAPKVSQIRWSAAEGSFKTKENTLSFTRAGNINPNNQFSRSNLEEIEYFFKDNMIVKRSRKDGDSDFREKPLLKQVESFQWTFIDNRLGKHTIWPPTRDLQATLPKAVLFSILTSDHGSFEKVVELIDNEI